MMLRVLLAISLFLLCSAVFGQGDKYNKSKELGFSVGTSYYIGEINQQHFGGRLNIGGGAFFRNNFNKRWSLRLGLHYGKVSAYDEDSEDPWQQNRNLSFENEIVEGSAIVELNYLEYQVGSRDDFWTPYLFTGIGYYSMNPKAEYKGNLFALQPLGTEGQGTTEGDNPYALSGISIPLGVGFKINVYGIIAINFEWGVRRTFTDYIDDISTHYANPAVLEEENGVIAAIMADRSIEQEGVFEDNADIKRGDPSSNDLFSFAHITIAIRIDKKPTSCWK